MKNFPDGQLFGSPGVAALKLCAETTNTLHLRPYHFLQNDLFAKIADLDLQQQVYWREMFQYVHWASMLNLLRHKRWQTGCIDAHKSPGNFFSFSANLRGMLESALDAEYSLGRIPMSLAQLHGDIQRVFRGERNATIIISREIEDLLIHFVYAKKLDKHEQRTAPASHRALEPKDYRNAIGLPEQEKSAFQQLYDDLCGYCHPTAKGLELLWNTLPTGAVEVRDLDDRAAISGFVAKHIDAIQFAISLSVGRSVLCLRTINRFDLPGLRCDSVEHWKFDGMLEWQKIKRLLEGPEGYVH